MLYDLGHIFLLYEVISIFQFFSMTFVLKDVCFLCQDKISHFYIGYVYFAKVFILKILL